MANLILNRLEMHAAQYVQTVKQEDDRHHRAQEAEFDQHSKEQMALNERRDELLSFELDNLVFNMRQRYKARNTPEAPDEWLHMLRFDETYRDLSDKQQADDRVREYFDPMLELCGGNKLILLSLYKRRLDQYFPIKRDDRAWNPLLIRVPFKPRRRSDTRTTTYTVVHKWKIA